MAHGIGIIGLGVMGERMLRAMERHASFTVAAVWDAAPDAAEKLQRIGKHARFARDPLDLVTDPAVACVYIATPPRTHLDYAHLAFDHGKAVFAEKPLSVDVEAARACASRVLREQRAAAINFPFAAAPAVRAIASGLGSGELGSIERIDIQLAFARWPRTWQAPARWLGQSEQGGFAREVLSHFIFLTQRLVGPMRIHDCRVDYPSDRGAAETAITATLMAGQIPVSVTGRVGGEIDDLNRWILTGSQGAFELHDWFRVKRRINGGWLEIDFGEGSVCDMAIRAQLDALDAMLSGRPHPLPSFREGLAVQECIEALLGRR